MAPTIPATKANEPASSRAAAPVKVAMGALAVALDQVATTGLLAGATGVTEEVVQAAQVEELGVALLALEVVQAPQVEVEAVVVVLVDQLSQPSVVVVVVEDQSDQVSVAFLVVDLGFSAFSVFSVLSDFSAFSLFLAVVFLVAVLAEAFCHGVSHVGQLGGCDGHSP